MLEVEYAVELAGFFFYVSVRVLLVRHVGFADGVGVVKRQRLLVELLEELVHARSVDVERSALLEVQRIFVVFQRINLGDHVEDVEPEAVHALVEPELQNVRHLFPHLRVLPVEIRLLRSEKVQVVFVCARDALPRRPCE